MDRCGQADVRGATAEQQWVRRVAFGEGACPAWGGAPTDSKCESVIQIYVSLYSKDWIKCKLKRKVSLSSSQEEERNASKKGNLLYMKIFEERQPIWLHDSSLCLEEKKITLLYPLRNLRLLPQRSGSGCGTNWRVGGGLGLVGGGSPFQEHERPRSRLRHALPCAEAAPGLSWIMLTTACYPPCQYHSHHRRLDSPFILSMQQSLNTEENLCLYWL